MAEPILAPEPLTTSTPAISRTIILAVALVSFSSLLLFPKSRTRWCCG